MDPEALKTKMEKYAGPYGGPYGLAQDHFYVSDLNDEALESLYSLVHNDYEQKLNRGPSNRQPESEVEALKSELVLVREFRARKLNVPKMEDALARAFMGLSNRIRKADEKTYEATTQPDVQDEHIHTIKALSARGDGVTEEAGNPAHTHNVVDYMVTPVDIDGYTSDHPGKVDVKIGKSAFRVIKSDDENGIVEWEADFDLFCKNEEQHLVCGIVYEPDTVDAQGDSAGPHEIVKACHNYMIKSRVIGDMHEKAVSKDDAVLVENFIAPCNYMEGTQLVQKGSWVQVHKVLSERIWKDIKGGKYTGFSMGGKARDANRTPKVSKRDEVLEGPALISRVLKLDANFEKVIRREDDKWCVFAHDGGRKLGCHESREDAFRQLAVIEANKGITPAHVTESKISKAEDYTISREKMAGICTRCSTLMKKKGIHKVRLGTITDRSKFKRVFGIRRSSINHNGLCRKFSTDAKLFKDAIEKGKL